MLIEAIRAGDRSAEFELDRRWRQRLVEVARPILRDDDWAQDAAQLTLWRAYLNLDRYDSSRPFEPWILAITRNCALDLWRRRQPKSLLSSAMSAESEVGPSSAGPHETASKEELEALQICMDGLGERSRTVVALFMSGFSLSESGRVLGTAKTTVQSWLQSAFEQLCRCMAGKGFVEGL